MGLVLSSVYSLSVNELLPPARSSFHSREYVYFKKSSPYLFKAAHSLLVCLAQSLNLFLCERDRPSLLFRKSRRSTNVRIDRLFECKT